MAELKAMPDVVFIDVEAGETEGGAKVRYRKEADEVIWHRWRPGAWIPVSLSASSTEDPSLTSGEYATPDLEVGWVYEAQIWGPQHDPNELPTDPEPAPLEDLAVPALRKRPEPREFIQEYEQRAGGTYYRRMFWTNEPVYAYVAVSTEDPFENAEGFWTFANPWRVAYRPLASSFKIDVYGLLPGNEYNTLTRVSDEYGNWQFLVDRVTTRSRRVRVRVESIFIDDDANTLTTGEGSIEFALDTGPGGTGPWERGPADAYWSDNLDTGHFVRPPPNIELEIGPEVVTPGTSLVSLSCWGHEMDDHKLLSKGGDFAGGRHLLDLPSGPHEVVRDRDEVMYASSQDDFAYTTRFKYSVDYV